jgi:ribosome biogenesis GTPase A
MENNFNERKNYVLNILNNSIQFAHRHGFPQYEARLTTLKTKLETRKIGVLVAGEARQGKSTLLSALIGEQGLFPSNVDINYLRCDYVDLR